MVKYTAAQKRAYAKRMANARSGRRYVRGRGDYAVSNKPRSKRSWSAPKTFSAMGAIAGGALGTALAPGIGEAAGGMIGSYAGRKLGQAFRSITGWGDYAIKSNTLVHPNQAVPMFDGSGSIRVRHKEYICSISSTTTFAIQSFALNPGQVETFPWLASIAQNYEQYRWNGMIFQFVSTSADALNSTNTALGKVVLATDYNAADTQYANIQQAMGSYFSNVGKPSESIMHAIECDPNQSPLKLSYVRLGDVEANADIRLSDLGNFQIATSGSQAAAVIGDLWVTYDITFVKPQLMAPLGLDLPSAHYVLTLPAVSGSYFGTSRQERDGSNLDVDITADAINFPETLEQGMYLINYSVSGGSATVVTPTLTFANCALVDDMFNGATASTISNSGVADDVYLLQFYVRISSGNASITLTGGTLPAGGSQVGDLLITQVPNDLV